MEERPFQSRDKGLKDSGFSMGPSPDYVKMKVLYLSVLVKMLGLFLTGWVARRK